MKNSTIKANKDKTESTRPFSISSSKYHKKRKKNRNPTSSKLNGPETSALNPILNVENHVENNMGSLEQIIQAVYNSTGENDLKPPYQFPLKDYTQVVCTIESKNKRHRP